MTILVRVDRTGKVWLGARPLGYVDRATGRLGEPAKASTWRYVNTAGWVSADRYPTRAAAVEALVAS